MLFRLLTLLPFLFLFWASAFAGELIVKTNRPPNFETPVKELYSPFTPNDRFFVRYHLSAIPEIDAKKWKLEIKGEGVAKPLSLTLSQLKKEFKPVEIAALAYCAGNQRALFKTRVPGVQWEYGAMGNAKWKGVKLKDILERAGVKPETLEISFNGADFPVMEKTPDFIKSIPLTKAMSEDTLIAFEMNGKPLPKLQGFPARVVVPGWTATYWMKHLVSIEALTKPESSFWMKTAYRVPKNTYPYKKDFISQEGEKNLAITDLVVNSVVTDVSKNEIKGLAWDWGSGIEKVEYSIDEGKSWKLAALGEDLGPYAWRQFHFKIEPSMVEAGSSAKLGVLTRATNRSGETQPLEEIPNGSGYHRNPVQRVEVSAK